MEKFIKELEGRLLPGMFRFVNEKIFLNPRMKIDEAVLNIYHEGFRMQSRKWPEKPLELVKKRLKPSDWIVDVGCGEAEISMHFPYVASIDINPCNERVIQSDSAQMPFQEGCFDVAVLCLSLMTENAFKVVEECCRILKDSGRLIIVEISSRIADKPQFIRDVRNVGFDLHEKYSNNYFELMEFKKNKESFRDKIKKVCLRPYIYKKR